MDEIKNYILNNEITLIVASPNSKILSIINLLNELSIQNNYKTTLFSFNISSNYYLQKLISFLSGIETKLIAKYFYPHNILSKCNKDQIDRNKFLDSIEKIQHSNLLINDEKSVDDKDYIDYILNYSDSEVLIIDDIYALLDKTKYNLDEIMAKIKKKQNVHLVLFVKTKCKEKVIKQFLEITKNYILIDGHNYPNYKQIDINILNKTIKLYFDKMNRIIKEKKDEKKLCNN